VSGRHISLGSDEGREIMVSDPKVSGLHATVTREADGSYVLRDRSRLGTRVNGEPVTETALRSGDLVRLGDSVDLIFTRIG
jgi:pSer/pThr/pTyr-binding forkhead associated (FHA) protein